MENTLENRLIWIDMEMTGLDPLKDQILEIAVLVTDANLEIVAEGPNLVVNQPEAVLAGMDEWNQTHHSQSGLLARVRASTLTVQAAEAEVLAFCAQHSARKASPLCGNSVWQDRRFLDRHMPALNGFFHYRIIDVSTVKELARRWYPGLPPFKKSEAHLALADIRESVGELKYLRANCFRN